MPTIFRLGSFRFYFYSNEGTPREPIHVHVSGQGGEAKFWVKDGAALSTSEGLDSKTLRSLHRAVLDNRKLIEKTWNEYFGD